MADIDRRLTVSLASRAACGNGARATAAHVEAINRDGLAVTGATELLARIEAVSRPEALAARAFDAVIVASGLPTRLVADPRGAIWTKFILNCAFNPVSALLRGIPEAKYRSDEVHALVGAFGAGGTRRGARAGPRAGDERGARQAAQLIRISAAARKASTPAGAPRRGSSRT